MSDCVTVSDATILYCSDIECTENTCYAAVTTVGGVATHYYGNLHLDSTRSFAAAKRYSDYHDYDEPQVLLDNGHTTHTL